MHFNRTKSSKSLLCLVGPGTNEKKKPSCFRSRVKKPSDGARSTKIAIKIKGYLCMRSYPWKMHIRRKFETIQSTIWNEHFFPSIAFVFTHVLNRLAFDAMAFGVYIFDSILTKGNNLSLYSLTFVGCATFQRQHKKKIRGNFVFFFPTALCFLWCLLHYSFGRNWLIRTISEIEQMFISSIFVLYFSSIEKIILFGKKKKNSNEEKNEIFLSISQHIHTVDLIFLILFFLFCVLIRVRHGNCINFAFSHHQIDWIHFSIPLF